MAKGKQARPTLTIKNDSDKSAKNRVEEMFGGVEQPVMHVEAVVPLPEHAETEPDNLSVRDIKDRVDALFDSIGTEAIADTMYPAGTKNNGVAAREFVVAEQLKKRAEKRYQKAKAEADLQGCFGDSEKYVEGDTVEVYRSPSFVFSVRKNEGTQMVNREATEEVLKEIAPGKWQELMKRCMKPRAGAQQIIVSLR